MIERKLDCILLIDDDKATNFLNTRLLKKMAVSDCIKIAQNGVEAIEYLNKSIGGEADFPWPDFILLDINMPLVNGWEFLDAYKKLPEDKKFSTVILMLTTSLREADHKRAESSTIVKGFIRKPLSKEELETAIMAHFTARDESES